MFALTSFFTLPSTKARQQPTWCCACMCIVHSNSGIRLWASERGRLREQMNSSAVCVCSILSFGRSFAIGVVCFLRGHTGLFICAQCLRALSLSHYVLGVPACSPWIPHALCWGHHLSLLLLFCCLCFELQRATKRLSPFGSAGCRSARLCYGLR